MPQTSARTARSRLQTSDCRGSYRPPTTERMIQILCDGLRYSVSILWRLDSFPLPDSMEVALSRLRALNRRLNRVPEKEQGYAGVICACLDGG
ncbi:hypothetical protein T01_12264 [Trichinella spiralis]|uniref:Uncharacterized protein n=1 Tax=Trichinella spiralis TaxID=6334 RepID=A0A0V1ARZ7_TRISP|nr:hypothetical protein T01_12264 [Trichinella spiralis]